MRGIGEGALEETFWFVSLLVTTCFYVQVVR